MASSLEPERLQSGSSFKARLRIAKLLKSSKSHTQMQQKLEAKLGANWRGFGAAMFRDLSLKVRANTPPYIGVLTGGKSKSR